MKKKIQIIFIILLILLIAIFISLKLLSKSQKQMDEEKINQELRAEKVEQYFSDKVLPQGVSTLYGKYNGKNDKNDLYRSISKMLNYLPQISTTLKSASVEEITEYYTVNESQIKEYLGISELEDFTNLANYLSVYSIDNSRYQYCSINGESYNDDGEYLTFDLNIAYEDMDMITLKVYFANSIAMSPKVMFSSK